MRTARSLLFLLIVWTQQAPAEVLSTRLTSVGRALAMAVEVYQEDHAGAIPKSWTDLEKGYIKRRVVEQQLGGPLEQKFPWFGDVAVQMASPGSDSFSGGQILSITATPVREDRRQTDGRYVVWHRTNGRVGFDWLEEEAVQKQFEEAGVPLPTGPINIQPTFKRPSVEDLVRAYAERHFKNPLNPTPEEFEQMRQYFAARSHENKATPEPPTTRDASTGTTATPSAPTAPATVRTDQERWIWPWLIAIAALCGAALLARSLRR
jgi:hypothetical protein